MRALSPFCCAVAYILLCASTPRAHGHIRRDSFSSPNGMKMVPVPAVGSPSDGSISGLANIDNFGYVVNITLGGSMFPVLVDTGSTDLDLFPDSPLIITSVIEGSPVNQSYGTGSFAGSIAYADLNVGGHSIDSQVFLNATTVGEFIVENLLPAGVRGIMGFDAGIGSTELQNELITKYGVKKGLEMGRTFLGNLFVQNPDLGNFTVVILGRTDDGESAGEGYLAIGEYPEQLRDSFSAVNYIDTVSRSGSFSVYVDIVSVNGEGVPLNSTVKGTPRGKAVATLDTGATVALVTQSIFDAIYSNIPGAFYSAEGGYYVVPCITSGAPNISITIGGQDIYINPLDLTNFTDLRPMGYDFSFCTSTIQVNDLGADFSGQDFLLGDTFLRNTYVMFYYGSRNATGGTVKKAAVKLVPETHDIDATYNDFLNVRRRTLASSSPEGTRAQIEKYLAEMSANSSSASDASIAGSAALAVDDNSDGSSYQTLLDKLNSFAPVVFGLLGAIVVVLLGLLGVSVTLCVRRGRTVGAARSTNTLYSPVPAPVRFKAPETNYKDEENALYGQ